MKIPTIIGIAAFLLALGSIAGAQVKGEVVSTGKIFDIKKSLLEEGTTVLLFVQGSSTIEKQFVSDLQKTLSDTKPDSKKVALRVARLMDLNSPAAKQYDIKATPTAIVYDRFGKVLGKTSEPDEIRAAVRKGVLMGRIHWVDEDDPKAPEVYGYAAEMIKHGIPGIVKTMALRPEAFKALNIMSEIHFSDGFLKRREHEMIAAYVSSLNKCKF